MKCAYLDRQEWDSLKHEVLGEDIRVDYTQLYPDSKPYVSSGAEQAGEWQKMSESVDKSQHVVT